MVKKISLKSRRYQISISTKEQDEELACRRHDVYAVELRQHETNRIGRLGDSLDDYNVNFVVCVGGELAGFISLTPPGKRGFSIDKYFKRSDLPFRIDESVWETRLLTVFKKHRGSVVSGLLMYGALRWVESHGGKQIVIIGHRGINEMYKRLGFQALGLSAQSGALTYDLLLGTVAQLRDKSEEQEKILNRLFDQTDWQLPVPFNPPVPCFHGGAFFKAIGECFDQLDRKNSVVNADVLDAWFPPSPKIISAINENLSWLLRTSPPTGCEGFLSEVANARGVKPCNVLPGAGSSDLIFRAFRQWLTQSSKVLILDPTYGEYSHVLEKVVRCRVDRVRLKYKNGFALDLNDFEQALEKKYDLIVLVNPNSPTGKYLSKENMIKILSQIPPTTRIWVDETYMEYVGFNQSLEQVAVSSENVIVCKSMSKVYALSGARVAYLCGGQHQMEPLRTITPPWVISMPAQLAGVYALDDPSYYEARYKETHVLREAFSSELSEIGLEVFPSVANFLLCKLPEGGKCAKDVVEACVLEGVYLRDVSSMGASIGANYLRIAVKNKSDNERILNALKTAING